MWSASQYTCHPNALTPLHPCWHHYTPDAPTPLPVGVLWPYTGVQCGWPSSPPATFNAPNTPYIPWQPPWCPLHPWHASDAPTPLIPCWPLGPYTHCHTNASLTPLHHWQPSDTPIPPANPLMPLHPCQWECCDPKLGSNVVSLLVHLPPQCPDTPTPLLTPLHPWGPYSPSSGSAVTLYWGPMWLASQSNCHLQCPQHPLHPLTASLMPPTPLTCLWCPNTPYPLLAPGSLHPLPHQCFPNTPTPLTAPWNPIPPANPLMPLQPCQWECCDPKLGSNVVSLPVHLPPQCPDTPTPLLTPLHPWGPYSPSSGSAVTLYWGPMWLASQSNCHLQCPQHPLHPLTASLIPPTPPDMPLMPQHP